MDYYKIRLALIVPHFGGLANMTSIGDAAEDQLRNIKIMVGMDEKFHPIKNTFDRKYKIEVI